MYSLLYRLAEYHTSELCLENVGSNNSNLSSIVLGGKIKALNDMLIDRFSKIFSRA